MGKRIVFTVALALLAMGAIQQAKAPAATTPRDCLGKGCTPDTRPARPIPDTQEARRRRDITLRLAAKAIVLKMLRDPESARFGDIFVSVKNGQSICGSVNAKNGFGGYTGMQTFVITLADAHIHMSDGAKWNRHCAGVSYTVR